MRRVLIASVAAVTVALAAVGPAAVTTRAVPPAEADVGEARAWLLRVSAPSGLLIRVADVSARTGAAAAAAGSPFAPSAAPGPFDAVAGEGPEMVAGAAYSWSDPTGSLVLQGGFAEAQAQTDQSSARAGFASGTTSGFYLASAFMTWEQQEEFAAQVQALSDAVFDPLNEALTAAAPLLEPTGMTLPFLEKPTPLGLIDFAGGRLVAAGVDVTDGLGNESARAEALLGGVKMFGGFIELREVAVDATADPYSSNDEWIPTARVGGLRIAGVPVVVDGSGIRVGGNDIVSRQLVQPAMNLLLSSLAEAGFVLRIGETVVEAGHRVATGLEVEIATPEGPIVFSLARAEAKAPPARTPPSALSESVIGGGVDDAGFDDGLATAALWIPDSFEPEPPPLASPIAPGAAPVGSGLLRRWPAAVARALRFGYLLLAVAGVGGALAIPMLVGRRRPSPTRRELSL